MQRQSLSGQSLTSNHIPPADQCLGKSEQQLFGKENTGVTGEHGGGWYEKCLWSIWISWSGCVPSQHLAHPAFLLWGHEKQKALMQAAVEKHSSVPARASTNAHLQKSPKSWFIVVCCFYKRGLPVWRIAFKKLFLNNFQSLPAESSKG